MPTGKARSGKRSTGAWSSTTTVIIFVALSALALWLFSSSSFGPLQTTSKASDQTPSEVTTTVRPEIVQDHSKPSISEIHQGHEDMPTEAALPVVDPAVKAVDTNDRSNQDDKKDFVSTDSTGKPEEKVLDNIDRNSEASLKHQKEEQEKQMALETQTSEESSFTHKEEVEQTAQQNPQENVKGVNEDQASKEKQDEKGSKADGVSEPKFDEKGSKADGTPETKLDEKGSKADGIPETKLDEKGSKVDGTSETRLDNKGSKVDGASEMKPDEKAPKIDGTSETKLDDKGSKVDGASQTKSDEKGSKAEGTLERSSKNDITDEDQRKRVEEHQKQEENQVTQGKQSKDPHGAVSDDQIQHDEATEEGKNPENPADGNKNSTSSKKNDNDPPTASNGEIPKESSESKKSWKTQADQSVNEKERRREDGPDDNEGNEDGYKWKLCNETAGADYIPCLDNEKAIAKIHKRKHYEHRERHCPEEPPTCLVPLPKGYKKPIKWPQSRDKIWYTNVPHTLLADVKGHQNWVKRTGEFLSFPGGGTQFIHGALHYIDFIQEAVPDIAWGKHTRVVLDVGCGVASFGGFLFERDVLTMSFAPKDEHEAQVQFALERGIPAISAVMGSQRLPFPSRVFDVLHCARCRVPWHADGGSLLLELNRVLRPGGYFVWSATPVYQKLEEDVEIWEEMSKLTVAMCWDLVTIKKDKLNSIGAAIYKKPDSNDCYEKRKKEDPPMCKDDDDSSAAWYVTLQSCMHRVPFKENERGFRWPEEWPKRVQTPPFWLNKTQMGIYGKLAPDDFVSDYQHWKKEINNTYVTKLGIDWSEVRNIMDMRAVYGGFAAAFKDMKVWVMNVVNVDAPDTLPIIYERGLFGIYHDWCESFSTYPRSYDLVHADHLLLKLQKRCKLEAVMAEIDRIVRPGGKVIIRDESNTVGKVESLLKSLHWVVKSKSSKNQEGIISAEKTEWRPSQS